MKRFSEDDAFLLGSDGHIGSAVIVEQIEEFSPKKFFEAVGLKILPKVDMKDSIKIHKKSKIITSTANSEDSRTMRAAVHPDITHESLEGKKVPEKNNNNPPKNLINEALDDFTSKQSEDTMVALVKRHESTKLLESVIKRPIFEPKIKVSAPSNKSNFFDHAR